MSKPRITVIMPHVNGSEYLEQAICSVLDQGYRKLELIVVDNGASDETMDLQALYEEEVASWLSIRGATIGAAINAAMAKATGDIVAVLTSDNLYLPGTLDAVAERMSHLDLPRWLVGHCVRVGPREELIAKIEPSVPESLAAFLMHDSGVLPLASTFWRREALASHGRFTEELQHAFDYELTCRLLSEDESPTILPVTLAAQRDPAFDTHAALTVQRGLELIAAARRYADRLPLQQRHPLWLNCDQRERIYTLAEAETQGSHSREFLWQKVLRHPWWLSDEKMRYQLVHGVEHTAPPHLAA